MSTQKKHIVWIDVVKGLGITFVVLGHVIKGGTTIWRIIFYFHVPLFFFISGYLFTPRGKLADCIREKTRRLIIPYFAFLIALSAISITRSLFSLAENISLLQMRSMVAIAFRYTRGGGVLTGIYGAFWFVTCLFIVTIVYQLLYRIAGGKKKVLVIILCLSYVVAMLTEPLFAGHPQPLGINAVPYALFFFGLGQLARKYDRVPASAPAVVAVAAAAGAGIVFSLSQGATLDMKYGYYGIPLLQPLVALCLIYLVSVLAQYLGSKKSTAALFGNLGHASIVILFLHQAVHVALLGIVGTIPALIFPFALAIPYLAFRIFSRFPVTSRLFVGR